MLTEHRSTPPLAATYARSYEAQKTAKLDYQTKELQRVDTPRQTTEKYSILSVNKTNQPKLAFNTRNTLSAGNF